MNWLPFFMAAVLLAITPGPGIAYVVARTAAGGRAEGLASCVGTALGGLVHVLAAALGVSLLIAQSAWAFALLKYVGAAYLVYLGLRMLLRSHAGTATTTGTADAGTGPSANAVVPQGARKAFREGVLVEALNVKTALFFLAFLPQFVVADTAMAPQLVVLGSICVALNTSVDVVAVLAAHRLLQSGPLRIVRARWMQRISGSTMVGLGVFLALARRQA